MVNDDETASDSITLMAAPTSLAESASATTITVTAALNGGTRDADTPVAVNVGSGTATSGADFAAVSVFTITIPANTLSQTGTFSLDPIQDAIDEPDETVVVDGSTTVSGISVTDTMVTITDDDSAPAVTLTLSDDPIGENGGATTVTASLSHASSEATTVTISVDPNSPATSSDYSISTNRVLTIAAGQTATAGTVTITAADNDIDAPDKTVKVKGEATNPLGTADPSDITLTITDDDMRGVTLSETDLDLEEGGDGTYTVVLDSEPTAAVTVTPSRSSGDSDVTVSGSLTFTASNWNTAQTVTVNAAQDSDPDDDTAVIGHSVAGGDYDSHDAESVTVTVNDDETASNGVTLTAGPTSLAESDSATTVTVTATLNGSTRDVDTLIAVNVGSGTATVGVDFAAVSAFTITIPANTLSQTGTFSLDPIQDAIDEPDETVAVDGSTTVSGISITDTTVTITDDDSAPAVTLSLSDDPIGENGGATTVTALLSHASSEATTVTISVDPDSPASSADYSISTNRILTIAAGQTSSTGTVTITAVDNDIDAPDKTVQITGDAANVLGIADPSDVTLTIADDDVRGVILSRTSLEIDEGDSGIYTVALNSEPTAAVTVTPTRTSGDSDLSVSGALTFTADNWDTAQTVTVSAAQDSDADDDTAVIGHSVAGGDYADLVAESVTVTVNDDETASNGVTLTAAPTSLTESASAATVTVTASLNGSTRDADTPVAVNVGSGTATVGADFAAVSAFTITIPANTLSQTGTFSLDPIQDAIDEPDETVAVDGSTTVSGISVTDTAITITDDDFAPTVALMLTPTTIAESDDPQTNDIEEHKTTVTATLSHASSTATAVTVSVVPSAPADSDDYELSDNRILTIAAGAIASSGTVTIRAIDNDEDEADRTFLVEGSAINSQGIGTVSGVNLTITDDDESNVNNKPYGTDRSVEFDEDNSYRFQATDFGFRDADAEDSLVSVRITSLPARGLLRVSGSQATAGQFISREEIDDGGLAFVPGANQHGSPYADFGFRFGDGKDESETANTMTLNVRSVNDPATGQPVISGAAVNGEVLSALTSQIRDIDGMTGASFQYQWFRLNGGEEIEIPEANGSTWSLMEADIGSALKVRVRFTDDDGFDEELFSDPTDAVEPAPPTEPINFRVVNGNDQAVLTWEPPLDDGGSEIVDYEIRHSQDVTVPDSQAWISTGTDLTETIPGISAGEHYSFEVRAVNQAGAGPPASSDLFAVDTRSPPGVPLNLTATPGDRQAILEWEPPASDGGAEISRYEYRYAQGVSVPDDIAWLSAGMALTVTVNGLINGQPCAFEVRAVNEIGAGPAAPATADLPIPATVPAAPRGLTAAAGERQVTLTWEPPANDGGAEISDYEVRFATDAGAPVDTEWQSVGTDLTESIAGLDADQRYRFEVRAVNSIGPGPAATASAATPRPKRISAALIEGWLARFGRTAASDTAEAIRQRLEEGPQRNQLVLNGRTVDSLFGRHEEEETKTLSLARMPEIGAGGYSAVPDIVSGFGVDFEVGMENGRFTNAGVGHNRGLPKLSDMLLRSSFHYAFAQEPELAGPEGMVTHTLWGSANGSRFDANIDALSLDGEVMTGTMGYDRHIGRLLTGVALSYSDGEGRFRDPAAGSGVIASELSGVYPYAYFQVDHRTSFWGVVGYGKGELQLMPDDASFRTAAADLDNAMAAFGGRGVLSIREGASRSFQLALRGDALLTDTSADRTPAFAESGASTQRLRLMLEATGSIRGANGIFSPTLEAGLRHDAGDAEQGTGFELGGGLAWSTGPLTLQLNGRGLLAHEDEAYREWGYSASVQYQPGTDGRGLLLDLSSARGSDNGGSARMWSMPDVGGMVREQRQSPGQSIRFRLGYGLESAGRRVLWHPFVGIETFTNEGRALRLGFRINAGERIEAGLEFGRRISGFELPLDTIQLRGTIRW